MAKRPLVLPKMPVCLPEDGTWLMKIVAMRKRFLFGMYRRHMRTIGFLGRIDKLIGVPITTRNWNTFASILKVLKS
jgi:uncharacterized protein (DUF1697 family)